MNSSPASSSLAHCRQIVGSRRPAVTGGFSFWIALMGASEPSLPVNEIQ
jgi:hypothetical protein